jgi:hypothetical protein
LAITVRSPVLAAKKIPDRHRGIDVGTGGAASLAKQDHVEHEVRIRGR